MVTLNCGCHFRSRILCLEIKANLEYQRVFLCVFSVSFESLAQSVSTTTATSSVSQPTQDVAADTTTSITEVTTAGQGEGQGQAALTETGEQSEKQR